MKKVFLIILVVFAIGLFNYLDLGQYLSLESLKDRRDQLLSFYQENKWQTIFSFIGVYIVAVALSLPGATILTLTGGAIFGAFTGMLLVNIGATLGAILAFFMARFLLRDWVESKFSEKLKKFDDGFEKNAFNYLLFLRLVPLFPFWLVNLASGMTKMPTWIYVLGTMIGILPGSFVYANAGSQLASINSLKDIASPGILGAFVLLGLLALVPTLYQNYKRKSQLEKTG